MPTHHIHSIFDAHRLTQRYSLGFCFSDDPACMESFACWLYQRTHRVWTEDLPKLIDLFLYERSSAASADKFDAMNVLNAGDAMSGAQHYEYRGYELLNAVRRAKLRPAGRAAWLLISELAVIRNRAERVAGLSHDMLAEVRRLLVQLNLILPTGHPDYVGGGALTDRLVLIDIEQLDETLSDERLWKDREQHMWPIEVRALRTLVNDGTLIGTIDAELRGSLAPPALLGEAGAH